MWTGPQGGEYELFIFYMMVLYRVANTFINCLDDMNNLHLVLADLHLHHWLHVTVTRRVS